MGVRVAPLFQDTRHIRTQDLAICDMKSDADACRLARRDANRRTEAEQSGAERSGRAVATQSTEEETVAAPHCAAQRYEDFLSSPLLSSPPVECCRFIYTVPLASITSHHVALIKQSNIDFVRLCVSALRIYKTPISTSHIHLNIFARSHPNEGLQIERLRLSGRCLSRLCNCERRSTRAPQVRSTAPLIIGVRSSGT